MQHHTPMRPYRWPSLDHLLAMTDDVGILQHATLDVPNRSCGYCTDDVGRALIVACDAAARQTAESAATRQSPDGGAARLITTYLSYLHDAQLPDGWFHNFMGYDRRWQDREGTHDAVGRAVWGLGYAEAHAPRESWRNVAGQLRRRALDAIRRMTHLRSRAYASLGLIHAIAARPADELSVRAVLDESLGAIASAFDSHSGPGWQWCEELMTYDNARLCEALLRGGAVLGNDRYVRTGLAMLEFYTSVVIEGDEGAGGQPVFVPVGNAGWYPRGGVKSRSGEQPLEAAGLVGAAFAALDATGDERWRGVAETAHEWYLGRNSNHLAVATETGCCDGLDANGVNGNMGAESTICYVMSAIALAQRTSPALRVAL